MAAKRKVRSASTLKAVQSLSEKHLRAFYNIYNAVEYDDLQEVVKNIEHNTMVNFFKLDHLRDPKYLAQEGAFSKGIVAGLQHLIRIIDAVPEEVDRREGKKKRSK